MTRRTEFVAGAKAMLPLLLGVIPFGLIVGVTATDAGFPPATVVGMSLVVFAGAAQLAVIELVGQDAAALVVVVTALVVNLRYFMYSASIAPRFREYAGRWRVAFSYLLTDQSYAVTITREGDVRWYYLGAALAIWATWQVCTVLGIVVGARLQGFSLAFTVPLTFMALLVPAIETRPHLAAAVVGGGVAVLANGMPYNLGLITGAVVGIAAGLVADRRLEATGGESA